MSTAKLCTLLTVCWFFNSVQSLENNGYLGDGNEKLKLYSQPYSIASAKAQCLEDGADLAYWNSYQEKSEIDKIIGGKNIWIGITIEGKQVITSDGSVLSDFESLYDFSLDSNQYDWQDIRQLCMQHTSIHVCDRDSMKAFVCKKVFTNIKPFFRKDYKYDGTYDYFYKKVDPMTWHQANEFCEKEGSRMATISHKHGAETLTSLLLPGEQLWIGASDFLVGNDFEGTDGEVLVEKFNHTNGHCVVIDDTGLQSAINCKTNNISFVCQKNYKSFNYKCDTVDDDYLKLQSSKKCVKYHSIPKNWHEALQTCRIENATLFIINNDHEASVLNTAFNSMKTAHEMFYHYDRSIFHVGFHDLFTNGMYKTVDGNYLTNSGFLKWSTHYPKPFIGMRCGGMVEGGTLQNGGCNVPAMFVCQKLA